VSTGGARLMLLGAGLALLVGCAYQVPIRHSSDEIELDVHPGSLILQGGTMASTRRFHILFFGFGERNSFLEAERRAIESSGSEMLVGRVRLRHFEGFLIPSLWLQSLGFQDATDLPVVGWEVYTVAGTGIRFVPGR